jgi:hypothetical protein
LILSPRAWYKHRVRVRHLVLLALLVMLGHAATTAGAAPTDRVKGVATCGSATTWTFLFWPNGHPAIPSVKFPKFARPHLEAYRGAGRRYPGSGLGGFVSTNGGGFAKTCRQVRGPARTTQIRNPAAAVRKTALVCRFSKPPVHELVQFSAGGQAWVAIEPSGRELVYATLKAKGSEIVYDKTRCTQRSMPS